jgi:hypothetical protein
MDFLVRLLDPRGLKLWMVILGLVLNLALTGLFFVAVNQVLIQQGGVFDGLDTILMLGEFMITLLIGFGITLLANDRRGPTYGVYGAIGSFVMITVIMYQSGLLTLLVGVIALLGGYNGGMIGERINLNRKK